VPAQAAPLTSSFRGALAVTETIDDRTSRQTVKGIRIQIVPFEEIPAESAARLARVSGPVTSWPAWNMSVALRSTHTLWMPRKSVQADLQTPSMRKGSPLALYWRTMATKSGT
jgi:hypothetical protein